MCGCVGGMSMAWDGKEGVGGGRGMRCEARGVCAARRRPCGEAPRTTRPGKGPFRKGPFSDGLPAPMEEGAARFCPPLSPLGANSGKHHFTEWFR